MDNIDDEEIENENNIETWTTDIKLPSKVTQIPRGPCYKGRISVIYKNDWKELGLVLGSTKLIA